MKQRTYYVIYNVSSTSAEESLRRIAELKEAAGPRHVYVIEMAKGQHGKVRDELRRLSRRFDEASVIAIAAGDGTVSTVVNLLMTDSELPDTARRVPVLPLWGGNGNDLARMLNGAPPPSIKPVIRHARPVSITPLLCRLDYPSGRKFEIVATNYVSVGASAYAITHVNSPGHRSNPLHKIPGTRIVSEAVAVMNGLTEAPLFRITERGATRKIYERMMTNGPRFAKNSLLPVELVEPGYFLATFRHKNIIWLIGHVIRSIRRNKRPLKRDTVFVCEDETRIQIDGESKKVPAGTRVTVGLAPYQFRALSTMIKAA